MKSGIFSLVQFVLKLFYPVTKSFYVNHQRKTLEKLVGKVGQSLNNFGITFTTTSAGCSLRNCEAKLAKTYLRILFQPSKQDLKKILPSIKYNFRQNLKNILCKQFLEAVRTEAVTEVSRGRPDRLDILHTSQATYGSRLSHHIALLSLPSDHFKHWQCSKLQN